MITNFNNFLNEGKYDKTILDISREFIGKLKNNFNSEFKYKTEYYLDDDNNEILKIKIHSQPNTNADYDFDIEARSDIYFGKFFIYINIIYNPEHFPFSYNNLIAKIKNTLKHEFTHITQDKNREEKLIAGDISTEKEEDFNFMKNNNYTTEDLEEYIFHPDEIEAFVDGFYKESKTKKQKFIQTIDNWFEENYQYFKTPANIIKLRKIWIQTFKDKYGTKHLK